MKNTNTSSTESTKIHTLSIYLLFLCFLGLPFYGWTQKSYFQQEVNYKIDVRLNDAQHLLHGFTEIEYINNSPDALGYIWFHIWPNAYKNRETALAAQLLRDKLDFHFAETDQRGWIDSLSFEVDGTSANTEAHPEHNDIIKLVLPRPLPSGGRVLIRTPFRVKFPGDFSRLGHVGESYQVSQWYPKPAVYDRKGWHPMPYLNQGEFYSEYGSYDVRITLPANYVVGATGDLQTPEEREFLMRKASETAQKKEFSSTNGFPPSSPQLKTLRFTQQDVHDFAWFADKRYHVLRGSVVLPHSGDSVETWVMFTNTEANLWKDAIPYVNNGIYYYSLWNGDYPYRQATAVFGALSAGGGMEYPNVTVIGKTGSAIALERVIVHELGHNWFYGILGSNERVHPWMDEGMNSFNELRYEELNMVGKSSLGEMKNSEFLRFFGLNRLSFRNEGYWTYLFNARFNRDQPIETHSEELTKLNYGGIPYQKTALAFMYLKGYLGEDRFDSCARAYFEKWKFKHPAPSDLKDVFEETSGEELNWFFQEFIQRKGAPDFGLANVRRQGDSIRVSVRNRSPYAAPVSLGLYADDSLLQTFAMPPFRGKKKVWLPLGGNTLVLDPEENITEKYRKNNYARTAGLFKHIEPLKINFITAIEHPKKTEINLLPVTGWNNNDGYMLGLALHNHNIFQRRFDYIAAPMYAFGRKDMSGLAHTVYHMYTQGLFERIDVGAGAMHFSEYHDEKYSSVWTRLEPKVSLIFAPRRMNSPLLHRIDIRAYVIHREEQALDLKAENTENFGEFRYNMMVNKPLSRFALNTRFIVHEDFSTWDATLQHRVVYNRKKRGVTLRAFGGVFLRNDSYNPQYNWRMDGQTGFYDYTYSHIYGDRSGRHGLWQQQFNDNHGAFKTPTAVGQSHEWLTALNLKLEAPVSFNFGVYGDIGFSSTVSGLYNAGFFVAPIRDIFEIYFPLLRHQDIENYYTANNMGYDVQIRFILHIHKLNPYHWLDDVRL